MRILLVEDDHRLNQSLKLILVEEGYAVDATFDGEEGEVWLPLLDHPTSHVLPL